MCAHVWDGVRGGVVSVESILRNEHGLIISCVVDLLIRKNHDFWLRIASKLSRTCDEENDLLFSRPSVTEHLSDIRPT